MEEDERPEAIAGQDEEKTSEASHKSFTEKVKEFKKNFKEDPRDGEAPPVVEADRVGEELAEARKLAEDYLDKLKRQMAEFDNFRKRTNTEKAGMYENGARDLAEKLLPVIDNLEAAISTASDKEDNFLKGVEMIYRQLLGALEESGMEAIAAAGRAFDPNLHNAVAHVRDEAFGENEVIEELRRGYKFKDKVIRVSMVRVAN